jgi:hypothetical protein
MHLARTVSLRHMNHICTLIAEEKNQYTLVGKASHPVAEAHLQLACQARTHLAKKVAVPNLVPKKEAYYKVFSDLDCLGGKEGVQVTPGGTGGYTMHILAPRPGLFNGSVTFMAESCRSSLGFRTNVL